MRAIGLMSGTSMDGIDVAFLETDGEDGLAFGPTGFRAYTDAERSLMRSALSAAVALEDRTARPGALAAAERMVTDAHALALQQFFEANQLTPSDVDVIGFHGQTVLHRPERRLTVQIGDAADLARRLGVVVMADMRAADVAAGGQGAPLVPAFHRALARAARLPDPTLVINIGGVSNITYLAGDADPIACDTGPGNALLDDLMFERTGMACDRDGAAAAAGQVDAAALARLLDHPYFARPAPKSLDRNAFTRDAVAALSTEDAAATLTAFTAAAIADALVHLAQAPALAVVCGGGAHNAALMTALQNRLPCPLKAASDVGWQTDSVEAQAFAYLAVRASRHLTLTFPLTTGVDRPLSGGMLFQP